MALLLHFGLFNLVFLAKSLRQSADQQSDDTRGKKRKSDDITSLGDTPKEPAKEKSNDS